QGSLVARASERLVKQLLPVLDDLERALEAAGAHEDEKLGEGVRLVHRALADALLREGLVEVSTDGAFDPHTQEALLSQPSDQAAEDRFKEIQTAYDVLSDPEKRKQYDTFGSANGRPGPTNFDFGDFDLGDIFGGLFGGARGRGRSQPQRGQRGADVEVEVRV